ncbi:hypothetical protein MYIN104542_16920 [Mycobacterium intermedium]
MPEAIFRLPATLLELRLAVAQSSVHNACGTRRYRSDEGVVVQ